MLTFASRRRSVDRPLHYSYTTISTILSIMTELFSSVCVGWDFDCVFADGRLIASLIFVVDVDGVDRSLADGCRVVDEDESSLLVDGVDCPLVNDVVLLCRVVDGVVRSLSSLLSRR